LADDSFLKLLQIANNFVFEIFILNFNHSLMLPKFSKAIFVHLTSREISSNDLYQLTSLLCWPWISNGISKQRYQGCRVSGNSLCCDRGFEPRRDTCNMRREFGMHGNGYLQSRDPFVASMGGESTQNRYWESQFQGRPMMPALYAALFALSVKNK
jgi:hypothetical protein